MIVSERLEGVESPAGAPRTVAGVFLWMVMAERRGSVRIVADGNRVQVLDLERNEPIVRTSAPAFGLLDPAHAADPSVFTSEADIREFFASLRTNTIVATTRKKLTVALRIAPPPTFVLATRRDLGPMGMQLDFNYQAPRWKWRLAHGQDRMRGWGAAMARWMRRSGRVTGGQILTNRRPEQVPGAYWRRLNWLRGWALLYLVACVGYFVMVFAGTSSRTVPLVLCSLWGMLMCFFWLAPSCIDRRLRREVLASGYLMCTQCGYSLQHLPPQHRCPECGANYTVEQLQRDWQTWYSGNADRSKKTS